MRQLKDQLVSQIARKKTMKRLLLFILMCVSIQGFGQDHILKGKVNGINPGDTVYLGAYSGKSLQYNDTTITKKDGWFSFEGKTYEKGGKHVVFILKPTVKMVEVLLDDKDVIFESDTSNMDLKMKVLESECNKVFYDYKRFIHKKNKLRAPLEQTCTDSTLTEEQRKMGCDGIKELTKEVIAEQKRIAQKHPDLLIGKYIQMGLELEVPSAPENIEDSTLWKFNYYQSHYWDNTDLDDPRIFREQQYHRLLEKYFTKTGYQRTNPDSLYKAAENFLTRIQSNKELFKYTLGQIAYMTESSKVMCMDKAFVRLVNTYYKTGIVDWIDDERMKKIIDGADKKAATLCGEVSSNIILPDTSDVWQDMHKIPEKYTILVFWEPSCGHCKKEIPKLKEVYDEWHDQGLEVYAVCHDLANDEWKEFVKEKDLNWINVSFNESIMDQDSASSLILSGITTIQSLNYSKTYDITSTPQIYMLDENKVILYKQLNADQIGGIMEDLLGVEKEILKSSEETFIMKEEEKPVLSAKELKALEKQKKKDAKLKLKAEKKRLKAEKKRLKAEAKAAKKKSE